MNSNNFGTVEFEGKELTLTQDAYAVNEGTDGKVVYRAAAIDADGNDYKVTWGTTEEWDLACEFDNLMSQSHPTDEQLERIDKLSDMVLLDCSDEANACDWRKPSKIEALN